MKFYGTQESNYDPGQSQNFFTETSDRTSNNIKNKYKNASQTIPVDYNPPVNSSRREITGSFLIAVLMIPTHSSTSLSVKVFWVERKIKE